MAMNRQTKRMMARRQQQQDRVAAMARRQAEAQRKQRVGPRQFLREVRQELKKVAWPTRKELFAYTLVVLVAVVVLTSFVFGLDYVIAKGLLVVFGGQGQ